MRVRGAPPDLLVAGGILWLIAVPSFWVAAIAVLSPLSAFGDCFEPDCPIRRDTVPSEVVPAALSLLVSAAVLVILLQAARRRPRLGYPIFAVLGVVILGWIAFVMAQGREPVLLLLLAGWPGWSGIAFLNAAWRASKLPRSNSDAHGAPGPKGYSGGGLTQ